MGKFCVEEGVLCVQDVAALNSGGVDFYEKVR